MAHKQPFQLDEHIPEELVSRTKPKIAGQRRKIKIEIISLKRYFLYTKIICM